MASGTVVGSTRSTSVNDNGTEGIGGDSHLNPRLIVSQGKKTEPLIDS